MKQKITFLLILIFLFFTSCNGQNSELTDFTIDKKELKTSNFNEINEIKNFPYGDDKDVLKEKKLKAYKVLDTNKINFLGVNGTELYLTAKQGKIQDYWLRIEGIDKVKNIYEKITRKYPNMTSYNDGVLRFKHFYNSNEVLELTINDLLPNDIFMDIQYTNNYENTSCNMFKNYDQNINSKSKKVKFEYNLETETYEIKRLYEE